MAVPLIICFVVLNTISANSYGSRDKIDYFKEYRSDPTVEPYYPETWNSSARANLYKMDDFVMLVVEPQNYSYEENLKLKRNDEVNGGDEVNIMTKSLLMNDILTQHGGFKKRVKRQQLGLVYPLMCGTYYMNPDTEINLATPNFPNPYSNFIKCDWTLMTDPGVGFVVDCPHFSLAPQDSFEIKRDSEMKCVSRYESNVGPQFEAVNNSRIEISFSSRYWSVGDGFACNVRAQKILPLTTTTTTTSTSTTTTTTTTVPTTEPLDPSISIRGCGISNYAQRIINGEIAQVHEYPWQIYLRIMWADKTPQVCGGSLISSDWILTAGHCVMRQDANATSLNLPNVVAYFGMHNRSSPFIDGGFSLRASKIVIHPQLSFSHDVALIRLESPVTFSDGVRPICLPLQTMSPVTGTEMSIVGWGTTETGKLSTALRKLSTTGIAAAECKKVFGNYITDHHFCTTSLNGTHICLGDSGGPVMTIKDNRFFLMGVVSFVATKDCSGKYPDGHSLVEFFIPWIREITKFDQL